MYVHVYLHVHVCTCVRVSVHVYVCLSAVCVPWHLCGGQRRTCGNCSFPFTLCIHGVGLGSPGLVVRTAEPSLWPLLGFFKISWSPLSDEAAQCGALAVSYVICGLGFFLSVIV